MEPFLPQKCSSNISHFWQVNPDFKIKNDKAKRNYFINSLLKSSELHESIAFYCHILVMVIWFAFHILFHYSWESIIFNSHFMQCWYNLLPSHLIAWHNIFITLILSWSFMSGLIKLYVCHITVAFIWNEVWKLPWNLVLAESKNHGLSVCCGVP